MDRATKTTANRALMRAIGLVGGPTKVGQLFEPSIRAQAISQWVICPAERALVLAAATNYAVTPHELRPDIYPHRHDGLPERLRRGAA
jgi:DNA-binding transcriptional regulator YdaS (Cro superfamily)